MTPRKKIWIILKTLQLRKYEKNTRKHPHTNGIKKAKDKRRMPIQIQITINLTENKRTCMMGLSLLLLKPNEIEKKTVIFDLKNLIASNHVLDLLAFSGSA